MADVKRKQEKNKSPGSARLIPPPLAEITRCYFVEWTSPFLKNIPFSLVAQIVRSRSGRRGRERRKRGALENRVPCAHSRQLIAKESSRWKIAESQAWLSREHNLSLSLCEYERTTCPRALSKTRSLCSVDFCAMFDCLRSIWVKKSICVNRWFEIWYNFLLLLAIWLVSGKILETNQVDTLSAKYQYTIRSTVFRIKILFTDSD